MRTLRGSPHSGTSTLIERRSAFGVNRLLEGCLGATLGVAMTGVGDSLGSAHAYAPDTEGASSRPGRRRGPRVRDGSA